MLIELGGGTNPHPRADIVIDLHHPVRSPAQDAARGHWRYTGERTSEHGRVPDGTADEVYASHFIEHIPKGQPLIDVFNEAWRVLKPEGSFTLIMPLVGYTDVVGQHHVVNRPEAYGDPTHVSAWWMPESFMHFTGTLAHADYGIHRWAPLGPWKTDAEITAILDSERTFPVPGRTSWWTVRSGWEGVVRLVKP